MSDTFTPPLSRLIPIPVTASPVAGSTFHRGAIILTTSHDAFIGFPIG